MSTSKKDRIFAAFDELYDADDRDAAASKLLGDRGRVSCGKLFPAITLSSTTFKRIAKIAQYNRGERSFTISELNCRQLAEIIVDICSTKQNTATAKKSSKTKRETPAQRRERLWNYYTDIGDVAAANAIERTML